MFVDFVKEFSKDSLIESIKAVVDNFPSRIEFSEKAVQGAYILIISFEEMVENIKDDGKVLITAGVYKEIIRQFAETKN